MGAMTREEAVAESKRLAREHPDRGASTWLPRQEESGDWIVVKVPGRKPQLNRDELQTGVDESVPPPPSQDGPSERKPYWG
jgi:hypothetical protein